MLALGTRATRLLSPTIHTPPRSFQSFHTHLLAVAVAATASASASMGKRKLSQTRLSANSFTTTAVDEAATPSSTFRARKIRNIPTNPTNKFPLTADGELATALAHLRAADPLLARAISIHSTPTFQPPRPPFHALSRSILYQQLALKAAATIYSRFLALCGGDAAVTPSTVLALTADQLRQVGVSGRKASYLHDLATNFNSRVLTDETVASMDDDTLFTKLTAVKGIGPWSVHMFMIFTLRRPDVLPVGDLSIRKGVQMLYGLKEVPSPAKVEELCQHWRPYRSVGSWYMYRLVEGKGSPVIVPAVVTVGDETPGEGEGANADLQRPRLVEPVQVIA